MKAIDKKKRAWKFQDSFAISFEMKNNPIEEKKLLVLQLFLFHFSIFAKFKRKWNLCSIFIESGNAWKILIISRNEKNIDWIDCWDKNKEQMEEM